MTFRDVPYHIERPDADLYVEEVGPQEGRVVFFIHGGPGYSSFSFRDLMGDELERYRMVYADQRGTGRSYSQAPFGLDILARDVVAILKALDLPPATLLAHGFGALIAVAAALQEPKQIGALILVNPWFSMPLLAARLLAEAQRFGDRTAVADPSDDAEGLVADAFALVPAKQLLDGMQFPNPASRLRLEHSDSEAVIGPPVPGAPEGLWDLTVLDDLPAVEQASVILASQADRTSYPEQVESGLERMPDALFSLVDAGHYPWLDDPDTFLPLLHRTIEGDPLG